MVISKKTILPKVSEGVQHFIGRGGGGPTGSKCLFL